MPQDSSFLYPRRAKQLIDFAGMQDGKKRPTDIDGLIEYGDVGYVLFEMKHRNAPMPDGQRLALERMANDFSFAGKQTLVVVCEHQVDDPNQPVILADTVCREFYYNFTWTPASSRTIEIVERFVAHLEQLKQEMWRRFSYKPTGK